MESKATEITSLLNMINQIFISGDICKKYVSDPCLKGRSCVHLHNNYNHLSAVVCFLVSTEFSLDNFFTTFINSDNYFHPPWL